MAMGSGVRGRLLLPCLSPAVAIDTVAVVSRLVTLASATAYNRGDARKRVRHRC